MAEAKHETNRAEQTAAAMRDSVIGGIHGTQSVASEGVHLVRDVAADTVRAAGEVGYVAIDTARGLLVGVADGLREVVTHVIPWRGIRSQEAPKEKH